MSLVDAVLQAGWTTVQPPSHAPVARIDRALAGLDRSAPLVGIDVGGTKVHGASWVPGACDLTEATSSTEQTGGQRAIDQITHLVAALASGGVPSAVALGVPGTPRPDGTVAHAPNVPGWDVIDVPTALGLRLGGAGVTMENDVNMAAWGEHMWGGERDLAFVAIGTGIGVGLVQDGRLVHGTEGGAGEVFDLPLVTDSAVPGADIIEDVASGPGLEREYAARSGMLAGSRDVLARVGTDQAAYDAVTAVAAAVAHLVAAIRCVLDPAVVVLGGGLGSQPVIVDAVRREIEGVVRRPVQVRVSALGPRAGTLGALGRAAQRITHSD